jgi:hypothetical protein
MTEDRVLSNICHKTLVAVNCRTVHATANSRTRDVVSVVDNKVPVAFDMGPGMADKAGKNGYSTS